MKSPFVSLSVVFAAGSLLAFAGHLAGLINLSGLSVLVGIGAYVACGVLAFAIGDYSRPTTYDAPRMRRTARQPAKQARPIDLGRTLGWTHHTISS